MSGVSVQVSEFRGSGLNDFGFWIADFGLKVFCQFKEKRLNESKLPSEILLSLNVVFGEVRFHSN